MSQKDPREAADLTVTQSGSLGQSKETTPLLSSEVSASGLDGPSQDAGDLEGHQADDISEPQKDLRKTSSQPRELNVSIASNKIDEVQNSVAGVGLRTNDDLEELWKDGFVQAMIPRTYLKSLEARVRELEFKVHELELQADDNTTEDSL